MMAMMARCVRAVTAFSQACRGVGMTAVATLLPACDTACTPEARHDPRAFSHDGGNATRMIARLAGTLRHRSHEARADLFLRLLNVPAGARVLDLGGADGSFAARLHSRRPDLRFTVADMAETRFLARDRYGFEEAALDPDAPLPFDDHAFDVVLCNSVIEHVTLPKQQCLDAVLSESEWRAAALRRQRLFADEIRRVGRSYFVQTPHPAFPIDAHTWLPFTSRLSHERVRRLVAVTDRLWVKKCGVADWHLLDERDMAALFPDARVLVERWLGLPKSVVAYRDG
jgi:hypothetical protein